jgi:mannose-6-phosphate isomerase-like protein (cupin superfamily)
MLTCVIDDDVREAASEVAVSCADINRALEVLTGLGFRVETIIAADDPAVAVISGHGLRLRLSREKDPPAEEPALLEAPLEPSFVVTRNDPEAWRVGRAGMHYRDLIPGRQGGRFIASHIRVPEGGPVPDYVHFHAIRFQMIYCYKGWVRLVYEDQGAPFVMHAGDCVLQPPKIRHRVLESSPGLEVIEIGSPASHATHADHAMTLPTSPVRTDRDFDGQRFLWDRPPGSRFRSSFAARSFGIEAATGALATARVLCDAGGGASPRMHDRDLFFGFVLQGAMTLTFEGETHRVTEADAFAIPAGRSFDLGEGTKDLAWLEVTVAGRAR